MKKGLLTIIFVVIIICCNCSINDESNAIENKNSEENEEQEKKLLIDNILKDFKGLIYLADWYEIRDYGMDGGIVYMEECPIEKKLK